METKYAANRKNHKTVTVILIVLAVLIAVVGVLSWMVLNDPNAGKGLESIQASDALPKEVAKSAVTQQESSFSVDDVNGYLAYLFQKSNLSKKSGSIQIQGVAVSSASGNSADMYLPVSYQGKHLGVVLNVTPSLDSTNNKLLFQVNSAQVGRLPVPVGLVMGKVQSHLPEGFSVSDSTIFCDCPAIEASVSGITASLKVGNFKIENGRLKIGSKAEIKVG